MAETQGAETTVGEKRKHCVIPETTSERYEREGRRMLAVQRVSVDPFAYCFEARDDERGREYGYLVYDILSGSKQLEKVITRLDSPEGCFADQEACDIMKAVIKHMVCDLFPDATEEDTSGMSHIWALGVILYYLLCGYPRLGSAPQVECYNNMKIGPKGWSTAWNSLEQSGHKFPSRKWSDVSDAAKKFIKDLSHYNPGNRPPLTDIWGVNGDQWYNKHAITWMSLLRGLSDDVVEFYDSDDSDGRTIPLSVCDEESVSPHEEAEEDKENKQPPNAIPSGKEYRC